jgi:hypothetical protein
MNEAVNRGRRQRPQRATALESLVTLSGHFGVLVGVGSPLFLDDKPLDQGEKAVIEIRIRDGLSFDDTQNLRGPRGHGDRRRTDSRTRRLLHFLELALLPLGGGEHDARAVFIVGASRLQTYRHVYLVRWLIIPSARQDSWLAGSIEHIALAQKRSLDAPADCITRADDRLRERSSAGEGTARHTLALGR